MAAQIAARAELSKIFSAEVKGRLHSSTSSNSKTQKDVVRGEITDDVFMTVEEKSEGVINAAAIKQTYEDKNNFYALVALKKDEAAKAILSEIQLIDEKIVAFFKENSRGSLARALKLYEERQLLHWRYEFLSGTAYPCPIRYQEMVDKKLVITKKTISVLLVVDLFSDTSAKKKWGKEIEHMAAKFLLDRDYKVSLRPKDSEHEKVLDVELEKEKMHFDVDGFEKYKITAVFSAKNKAGEKISQINFVSEFTGRNFEQALENALPEIKKFLNDHFDELNFE